MPTEDKVEQAKKSPSVQQYVVAPGHGIAPFGNYIGAEGSDWQEARVYESGEVVVLTSALAKHYIAIGALVPHVPDE